METNKIIEQLALKFGTTSEHLWQVLINQAFVDSVYKIGESLVLIILMYLMYRTAKNWMVAGKLKESIDNFETYYMYRIAMTIMTFLSILFFFCISYDIQNAINGFINPEYWAIEKVLSFFGK